MLLLRQVMCWLRCTVQGSAACWLVACTHVHVMTWTPSSCNTYDLNKQCGNVVPVLTSLPSLTPISCATRAATLMAATRRGWVQPILPSLL